MEPEQEQLDIGDGSRIESGALPLDRLKGFSDGVFAIVITLLVLELPVPGPTEEVLPALAEAWPDFLGYVISFAFVGGIWLSHAGLTKFMKRGDAISFRLNLVVLLFVSLLPFSTKIMVTHMRGESARSGAMIYGLNVLIASTLLTLLMVYLERHHDLMGANIPEDRLGRATRQRRAALALNALAIFVAVIAPNIAIIMYIIVAAMFIIQPFVGAWRSH